LSLAAYIAAIENAVSVAAIARTTLRLADRGQLDDREARLPELSNLTGKEIEQPRGPRRRRGGGNRNSAPIMSEETAPRHQSYAHSIASSRNHI
jgi:hypothetical protein